MTRHLKILSVLLIAIFSFSAKNVNDQNPVLWNFSARKISDSKYEVLLTATIKNGWHIYSMYQPKNAIASPLAVKFKKNPFMRLKGIIKEEGQLLKVKERELDAETWQFSDKVSFVQEVELKNKIKTNVNGTIKFQACTNTRCLLPVTIAFSIVLE